MARDEERQLRAQEEPIVGGLPDVPGIGVAMRLTPAAGRPPARPRRPGPGRAISRARRITPRAARDARDGRLGGERLLLLHGLARGASPRPCSSARAASSSARCSTRSRSARPTASTPRCRPCCTSRAPSAATRSALTEADTDAACAAGATDADVQLAVLIAAAFSMYNRLVDGFRARTPATRRCYRARAGEIAENGYSAPSQRRSAASTARRAKRRLTPRRLFAAAVGRRCCHRRRGRRADRSPTARPARPAAHLISSTRRSRRASSTPTRAISTISSAVASLRLTAMTTGCRTSTSQAATRPRPSSSTSRRRAARSSSSHSRMPSRT